MKPKKPKFIELVSRIHCEIVVGEHSNVTGAVVKLLTRRGDDVSRARAELFEGGAAHVSVVPLAEDKIAELPQRETISADPVTALRAYATRDPVPEGTDLHSLAKLVF